MKKAILSCAFVALASMASSALAEQIFKSSIEVEVDGIVKTYDASAVLKDEGKAAEITINGVAMTFPYVDGYRCAGCLGVFGDSFTYDEQTVRFALWTNGADNTIDMEIFDYNPFSIMKADYKTKAGKVVELAAFASSDEENALVGMKGSFYILNKVADARCMECLGIYADVARSDDLDDANMALTLFNEMHLDGVHAEVNTLNFGKLFNNADTYLGSFGEDFNKVQFMAYLSNDGMQVDLRHYEDSFKLNKVGQPKCKDCMGQFADVETAADLKNAKVALTLWKAFDSEKGTYSHTIEFNQMELKLD